ncbi:MAG: hypothetical protein ACLS48_12525 [[Eubacterium] siraeum]
MSIEEILEAMDIELDKSKSVPLTRGKSLIDVEQFGDLIGQVRLNPRRNKTGTGTCKRPQSDY